MTICVDENFPLDDDPLWYKDAILYELHVKSYFDSNADGIGDFRGLTQKLEYLRDLGVSGIWLLPFCPSPLRDDGYDISDYTGIHPSYGTMSDFKKFLYEAHRCGLRVISEVVLNHSSDRHPWFQRARRAKPGSAWRNFYVWSDSSSEYQEARIIFKDFETSNWSWDPVAKAYFWHRFYSHQPDLNYESAQVRRAMLRVIDFWLDLGVDGLRLDAVPYLYEREGTNCENLPETYEFLRTLRAHVDQKYRNRMLLAEANQWPEDAAAYFGDGDICHMAFHFPVMPRLFMAIYMEDRFPILDILDQTPAIPENCQWAVFLRNHDELTLEMVTDEERDYMYRVCARDSKMRINLGIRRRLATLLGNNRRRIELMKGLLFSLPGTPVLYYGDEMRMGDNIYLGDRDGVRTPMQWNSDRNAGFSRANPQQLYLPIIIDPQYHYEAINAENEQQNPHSFLWWMKRLIGLRKQFKAFGRGTIQFLQPENRKVLAFLRSYEQEHLLVVANLSRFAQSAFLDLTDFQGMIPVELFGRTQFPAIGEEPYFLTLGAHSFYWFSLESHRPEQIKQFMVSPAPVCSIPRIMVDGSWFDLFHGRGRRDLEGALPGWLVMQRWFRGKTRTIKSVFLREVIRASRRGQDFAITLLHVEYTVEDPEVYLVPLTALSTDSEDARRFPAAVICRLHSGKGEETAAIVDAVIDVNFCQYLFEVTAYRRQSRGMEGELAGSVTRAFRTLRSPDGEAMAPTVIGGEQNNTSVIYGKRFVLKLFRRLEAGINPDLEVGGFLTRAGFVHIPQVAGAIEYHRGGEENRTVAILHSF
ncbi:MAG TPA: maltose alpha-D-glucosyltransferase, partial [Thermodesulfobacteriota bacterium]|nr:maltose alpha-D-glucosyltransferase [Thermodesulfobacteriota bacterium]